MRKAQLPHRSIIAPTMQRRHLLQQLLTTTTLALPGFARSATSPAAALQDLADQAESSGALPGFQLAVVAERRQLWSTARGLADASIGLATTEATGYYIASTTKCFTALAAAQRAARGELDLQASLARLLPQADWRSSLQADRITLRELLTHTHGIDADSVPAQLRVNFSGVYRDNAELLNWLALATPAAGGKRFAYSNLGYDLAGMAMAPAGRDGWKVQVQREVLDPLGLKRTSPWRSALAMMPLAAPHGDSPQGWRALPANKQDSNMGPAGGLFATARDLARLIQVLLDSGRLDGRSVLPPGVLDLILNRQVVQDRQVLGYQRNGHSLGFDLARLHGQQILTRMGSFRGASSHLSFMPARGAGCRLADQWRRGRRHGRRATGAVDLPLPAWRPGRCAAGAGRRPATDRADPGAPACGTPARAGKPVATATRCLGRPLPRRAARRSGSGLDGADPARALGRAGQ